MNINEPVPLIFHRASHRRYLEDILSVNVVTTLLHHRKQLTINIHMIVVWSTKHSFVMLST